MKHSVEFRKDIPIPISMQKKFREKLAKIGIGESFDVSSEERFSVRNAIHFIQLQSGVKKFATRTLSDNNQRIWRIE